MFGYAGLLAAHAELSNQIAQEKYRRAMERYNQRYLSYSANVLAAKNKLSFELAGEKYKQALERLGKSTVDCRGCGASYKAHLVACDYCGKVYG